MPSHSSYPRLICRREAAVSHLSVSNYCVSVRRHRLFGMRKARITHRLIEAALLFACAMLVPFDRAHAQGLSGASVEGAVVSDSVPITGATVILTDVRSGVTRRTRSGRNGSYSFDNVSISTYRIEARAVGLLPAVEKLELDLGDRLRLDLVLHRRAPAKLEKITVTSAILRDAGARGPAHTIGREAIRSLPLLNRDFVGLFSMSPQAVGPASLSVSGQHSRFNAIQIDGAIRNDLFGVSVTPGSGAGGKSVSLEALEQIRVLIAPFDVKQGGFSGGLIND